MEALIIAGCCLLGSILSGLAGWLKSGEPFVARDFIVSILSGVGAAIVFALAYNYTSEGITIYDVLASLAAGMGVDVAVNRVAGAVRTSTIKRLNKDS